jgi:hypothetical protein
MEKSVLYEAFQSLSNAETREFGKFIQSPYYNLQPRAFLLFEYLLECVRAKKPPLSSEAFQCIFPGQEYKDAAMRASNSYLYGLLEQFLVEQERAQNTQSQVFLAAAYRKRNLPKHFKTALREAREQIEAQPWRDTGFYQDLYRVEWEQYQQDAVSRRTEALNLQAVSDTLDSDFIIKKLRVACFAISHQAVYKASYDIGFLPYIWEAAGRYEHIPIVSLYRLCYGFFSTENAFAYFSKFREILVMHAPVLPQEELRILHLLAINFGIKRVNESREGWLQETLSLYKSALERGLLMENGLLSRFAFNNIVAIALRVGEADWTSSFIHQNKPYLERQFREATAGLCLARVAYFQKDYKTALLHLQRADYKDTMNNLSAKTLQLKIYFETSEWDILESHLASMQTFIRRHFAIGYHRTNYSRIISYTRQMMQLDYKNQPTVLALLHSIEQDDILTEKEWFKAHLSPS